MNNLIENELVEAIYFTRYFPLVRGTPVTDLTPPPPLPLPPPPPPAPIAFLVTTYQNSRENRNKFTTIHAGKNKATEPIQR